MNRFSKAWLALTDRLEPEVILTERFFLTPPHMVDLYAVSVPDTTSENYGCYNGEVLWERYLDQYYATCEQAHASAGGSVVRVTKAIRVGDTYLVARDLKEVKLQPKPKVAKGRK
jgi:hypothetical protein